MIKLFVLMIGCLLGVNANANDMDLQKMDRGIRSSKSRSIMFQRDGQEILEERERQRQIEEQKKKEEEQRLKREQQMLRAYSLFGNGFKVMAVINGEMVSNKDLQERANLFSLTTGLMVGEKNKEMVKDKVLQNTIDEKLKLQEKILKTK